jgi:hypothetical protein
MRFRHASPDATNRNDQTEETGLICENPPKREKAGRSLLFEKEFERGI